MLGVVVERRFYGIDGVRDQGLGMYKCENCMVL